MVAAGVYLLAVTSVFIGFTPTDQLAIVAVGGITTIWAASMGLVNTDIKRVIAYSTVSQLGYMVFAVGAGFAMVGLFHLFTHAFFKALLFLSAGAVIHAVGSQDLFKMGGLRRALPVTSTAFLIGALSLSGIPPFAGFFSKDDILGSVYPVLAAHPLYWPFFLCALSTVFLTAYYIFRAWFLAFSGRSTRDPSLSHAHEGPWVMQVPLVVLSGLAIGAGLLVFLPSFQSLLPGAGIPPSFSTTDLTLSGVSVALGAGGVLTAWSLWGDGRLFQWSAGSPALAVQRVLLRRYYVKDAVDVFGLKVVYGIARAADFVDTFVIDGTIHGFERLFADLSDRLRAIQSGRVSDYAGYVAGGLVGLFLLLVFVGPWVSKAWGA
jgi:NADH-quinone oxidoreductase subunit L